MTGVLVGGGHVGTDGYRRKIVWRQRTQGSKPVNSLCFPPLNIEVLFNFTDNVLWWDRVGFFLSIQTWLVADYRHQQLSTGSKWPQCHRREETKIYDPTSHRYSTRPDLVIAEGLVGIGMVHACLYKMFLPFFWCHRQSFSFFFYLALPSFLPPCLPF